MLLKERTDVNAFGCIFVLHSKGFNRNGLKRLQCLHSPKQESNDNNGIHLCQILLNHLSRICEIDLINGKKSDHEEQALPHFLVLQIGIVLMQPTAILYQRIYIIYDKDNHDSQLPVCRHFKTIEFVVSDDSNGGGHDDGHLRQDPRPDLAPAVLQHTQQHGHSKRHKRYMVEHYPHDITYQTRI